MALIQHPPTTSSSVWRTSANNIILNTSTSSSHRPLILRAKGYVKPTGKRVIRAYLDQPNPLKEFASKVIGALPVVGLLYRILNDEGGVGGERIQFPEFCTRVEKRCPPESSMSFYEFKERYGKRGNPRYVLFWCWVAAVGGGLVKSDDILIGASTLRASFDLPYEESRFNTLMDDATAKRAKAKLPLPEIPVEARVEKALEAICRCCIGKDTIDEEDAKLLYKMLCAIFPSADKVEVESYVWRRVKDDKKKIKAVKVE